MDSTIPAPVPPTGVPVPLVGDISPLSPRAGKRVRRTITTTGALVIGTAFAFSFGNTTELGLSMGLPLWLALALAPAVDLTILATVWGIRYASLSGICGSRLWPARLLLVAAGLITWGLNTAAAWSAEDLGKVALDSIAPALLYTWAEIGPWFLRLFVEIRAREVAAAPAARPARPARRSAPAKRPAPQASPPGTPVVEATPARRKPGPNGDLARRMAAYVLNAREEGRDPTGGELDRMFGTSEGYGRRVKRTLGPFAPSTEAA